MGIKLNKGLILGIAGGIIVFIVALIFIMYSNSDFDSQLINQVESGVPSDKLIPQIDKETNNMKLNAQRRLGSNTVNKNLNKNDSESYFLSFEAEMKMISQYDEARKKYANRAITKERFFNDIQKPKEFMDLFY
ncbi:MAG: hypothetical protein ACXVHO_06315 [Methanobacterium sp.]